MGRVNDDYYDSNDEGREANDYPEEDEEFPSDDELFWENHRMRMHARGIRLDNDDDNQHEANLWINKKQDEYSLDGLAYKKDDEDDYNDYYMPNHNEENED